jgi:hypothetical protein
MRRGGLEAAGPILESAAMRTPPGPTQGRRLISAGEALLVAGLVPRAVNLLEQAMVTSDPALRADAAPTRSQASLFGPLIAQAADTAAREARNLADHDPTRAALGLVQAAIGTQNQGLIPVALRLARQAYDTVLGGGGARCSLSPNWPSL